MVPLWILKPFILSKYTKVYVDLTIQNVAGLDNWNRNGKRSRTRISGLQRTMGSYSPFVPQEMEKFMITTKCYSRSEKVC